MTKGRPLGLIVRFMLPLVAGNIFQQLYNIVDSIIVGKFIGTDALAAVGATGTIMFLIIGFMGGLTSGFTVVTAQRFGAHDRDAVRETVCGASILAGSIAVIMTVISLIGMKGLLTLMNTPDDVFDMSYTYITTIFSGLFFTVLYNLTAGLLRAIGNSRVPLYFLLLASCLNIGLDLTFILLCNMGVFGAALATVISQAVSGVACLCYIVFRTPELSPKKSDWQGAKKFMKLQFRIGLPMALQFSITAIGTIIVQSALNTLGSTVMAAFTASQKVESLVTQPFSGMGMTMATYSGQNYGVGDFRRIRRGAFVGTVISCIYAVLVGVLIALTPQYTVPMFIDGDPSLILQYAAVYFSIIPKYFIPLGLIFVFRNVLQGMGYAITTLMGGFIELGSRVVLSVYAIRNASFAGVCYADVAAWVCTGVFLVICYIVVFARKRRAMVLKEE